MGLPAGTRFLLCRAHACGRNFAPAARRQRYALVGVVIDRSRSAAGFAGSGAACNQSRPQKRRVALKAFRAEGERSIKLDIDVDPQSLL
jgi:hypothetical protein